MKAAINNQGYSLTEMLAALGVSSVILLAAMSWMANLYRNKLQTENTITCETQTVAAMSALEEVFFRATMVNQFVNFPLPISIPNGLGMVRQYSYTQFSDGLSVALAAFSREGARSTIPGTEATLTSRLFPTAIFFQPPTAVYSGVLYITLGDESTPSNNLVPMRNGSNLFFPCITGLRIFNPRMVQGALNSFTIELTTRSFLPGSDLPMKWCPAPDIAAGNPDCVGGRQFRDITRTQTFFLRNNHTTSADQLPGFRFSSGAYFFPPSKAN